MSGNRVSWCIDEVYQSLKNAIQMQPDEPVEVTADMLADKAREMTRRCGYIHDRSSLEALNAYLKGYGLMLFGKCGVGKTFFFRALKPGGMMIITPMKLIPKDIKEVEDIVRDSIHRELLIDDIGAEPAYSNYGVKFELLPWIVEVRLACGERTHFTSNLTKDELVTRYGARTCDRIRELTVSMTLEGVSKRVPRIFCNKKGTR